MVAASISTAHPKNLDMGNVVETPPVTRTQMVYGSKCIRDIPVM